MKLRALPSAPHSFLKPLASPRAPRTQAQIRTGRSDLSHFTGGAAAKPAGRTDADIRHGRSDLSLFTGAKRPSAPVAGDGFVQGNGGAATKPGPQTSVAAAATGPGAGDDVGKAVGSVAQALLDSVAAPFKFLGSLFGF